VTDAALGPGKPLVTTMQKINSGEIPSPRTVPAQSSVDEARDRLAGLLPDDALADALRGLGADEITGPGGLLTQLAGRVIETALGAELSNHLGYPPGQAPPGGAGNHRNGHTPKTVQTELGPVQVKTPRDRQGSFDPKLVAKRQTRLAGLDEKILALYGGGMTVRDIASHLQDLYGVEIARDTISRVTDAVLEDVVAWRTRPLEAVYPIVYFDALMVKVREDRSVRTRACYLAIGVSVEGDREVLGIWWQETEGAKFWLAVLNDLHRRGVEDVLIACVDGLKGFPEAVEAVFPQAWVQSCVVHQIRASLRYVTYTDRKKVAADLRTVYSALDADHAEDQLAAFDEKWGARYPMIADAWRSRWEYLTPFLALPADLRRVVYTTDESVKGRGSLVVLEPGLVRLRAGRGRPPSEARDPGLSPAAQLLPRLRAVRVAPRWRRPRPSAWRPVPWPASRRPAGDSCARPARRAPSRARGRP
jgi:putative transposase